MSRRILVVDDSPVIRSVMQDVLVTVGCSVTTAPDGVQALEMMHTRYFDLLFLDIDMPNLSGLQVCRMIRNDPAFSGFPIIMLTGRDRKQDKFWGEETGADAYIFKPFEPENLLEKMEEVIAASNWTPGRVAKTRLPAGGGEKPADLIFEAGQVQEREIFRITLMNRIYEISYRRESLRDTIRDVVQLFSSLLDFQMAVLYVFDEDSAQMFVHVTGPSSKKFFQSARRRVMSEVLSRAGRDLDAGNVDVTMEDPDRRLVQGGNEDELVDCHAVLLEGKGETYGVFAVSRNAGKPFNHEEIVMIKTVCDHASIVVDNVRMHEKIKRFAIVDGLTGLYNHRYFQEQLDKEYSRAQRYSLSLSLLMLDIDNFKRVNDGYGHQHGDTVLKGLSAIIRRSVRDIDIAARYGGEEFVVILPETRKENARFVAERIRAKTEDQHYDLGGERVKVPVSIGISGYPDDNVSGRLDLIAKADHALYQAKRTGRNRVCLFNPAEGGA
ncbi:MAG: diguanylate cyclase [bacterium]